MASYRFIGTLAPLLFGCVGLGEQHDSDPQVRTFTGTEVRRILTGNTLVGDDVGGPYWLHYPADGVVWGVASNGDVDVGRWYVDGNHYCDYWRRWRDSAGQCWLLATDGIDRLMWIDSGGRSAGENAIQAGNSIGEIRPAEPIARLLDREIRTRSAAATWDRPVDAAGNLLLADTASDRGRDPSGIDAGQHAGGANGAAADTSGSAAPGGTNSSPSGGGAASGGGSGGSDTSASSGPSGGGSSSGEDGGDDRDDRDDDGDD